MLKLLKKSEDKSEFYSIFHLYCSFLDPSLFNYFCHTSFVILFIYLYTQRQSYVKKMEKSKNFCAKY